MLAPVAIALSCQLVTLAAGAPSHRRFLQKNLPRASAASTLPTFEFLKNGVAANEECTGAALTGSLGETITFTRASSQTCVKSDGTMVTLTTDQPALESAGLHVEPAVVHYAQRSEELDHATWNKGCGTATANQGVGPEGLTNLEKYTFTTLGACYQIPATSSSTTFTYSIYSRTDSVAKTILVGMSCNSLANIVINDCYCEHSDGSACVADRTTIGTGYCVTDFTTTATPMNTTLHVTCASATTGPTIIFRGGNIAGTGATSGTALFGYADLVVGLVKPSYAQTVGSSVTTAVTNTNLPNLTLSGTSSIAYTITRPGITSGATHVVAGVAAADRLVAYENAATGRPSCSAGTAIHNHTGTMTANTAQRIACAYNGSDVISCLAGSCESTTAASGSLTSATTANAVGYFRPQTNLYSNSWIKAVCIDSTSGGCR